ncbi:mate-domain-containing protein [Lineolata rhizophorae]|uniref:Mate-domain-containing protein n=1 Tax=Lineolata rhizophorae TaxID=578093 RepID=A0A6A6NMG6_9PEZI|nr:mate-domain-containing protein [Lineolata rhizophorae]
MSSTHTVDETTSLLASANSTTEEHYGRRAHGSPVRPGVEIIWNKELRLLFGQSTSLAATWLLQYFYNLIIILVASRLGTDELAAVSVGMITMNITGYAVFEGMATSLDTLCAQAYGSGNLKLVGLHMHRMIVFQLLVAVPVGAMWLCSPWILKVVVLQQDLPALAGVLLSISLIGVPGYAIFESGKRFAQAQGNFNAALIVLIICAPINLILSWVFAFRLEWGVPGAALATALTNDIRPLFLLVYLRHIAPQTLQCWHPFSKSIFQNWSPMVWLSIPGVVMTLCEWFAFELLTFTTSYLGTAPLAAQTFLSSTSVLIWHIPFATSVALSTRMGQLIGGGYMTATKKVARISCFVFAVVGVLDLMLMVIALRDVVASVFIRDEAVREIVRTTVAAVAGFQFFDAVACGVHGIVRGLGAQAIAGWVTFGVNYAYAVPLALVLELGPPKLGLNGLWVALGSGLCLVAVIEGVIVKCIDWQRFAIDATKRDEEVATAG